MPNKLTINTAEFEKAMQELSGRFPKMGIALRSKALEANLRAAGRPLVAAAKRSVPQPGYPGDKPGLKALRDTIRLRIKQYDSAWVLLAGPVWPAGSHGHNVEFGHRIARGRSGRFRNVLGARRVQRVNEVVATGRTRAVLFMDKAFRQTSALVQRAFSESARKVIEKTWQTSQRTSRRT